MNSVLVYYRSFLFIAVVALCFFRNDCNSKECDELRERLAETQKGLRKCSSDIFESSWAMSDDRRVLDILTFSGQMRSVVEVLHINLTLPDLLFDIPEGPGIDGNGEGATTLTRNSPKFTIKLPIQIYIPWKAGKLIPGQTRTKNIPKATAADAPKTANVTGTAATSRSSHW